ncbi:MAG TPA: peptidoglycan recognition family protein [Pseudonocardiaceae bacterium]
MRTVLAAALTAGTLGALTVSGAAQAQPPVSERQQAYAAAAAEFGVPQGVLLAVSYLQSRWDTNAGTPSTTAGYGPMHLTDAAPFLEGTHHDHGDEDPRGDETRPLTVEASGATEVTEAQRTLLTTAGLTGVDAATLKADPAQNIRGGAALLASYQRELGAPLSGDPADWYGAVARYGGSTDAASARRFADEVYGQLRAGADRVTDDGQRVVLAPAAVEPDRTWLDRLGLPPGARSTDTECPSDLACEWIPAPYQVTAPNDYGNHDKSRREENQQIRYIVIHDTEGSYNGTIRLVQDPNYVSWQYTLRSSDGHVAQHVRSNDVAWHAGNWYVNAAAIGLEHEGFAASGTWYTEAMYRSSAKLVRYLAQRFGIPLDRHHIIGHDQVPGILPANVRGMHWDPGPYWNWNHYFDLLGAPLEPTAPRGSTVVTMRPKWETNRPAFYGCDRANPGALCPSRSSSSVILRSEPRHDAPLVRDIGLRPDGSPSTMHVSDHGARASAGTQWAVAEVRGDWTAVWYLGQKAWFHNPRSNPAAVPAGGVVVTPKAGRTSIPVYGRAYPEASAYPSTIPVQTVAPLQYSLLAGQEYVLGQTMLPEYYRAVTYNCSGPGDCTVVRGQDRYYQIQFGHRMMFVRAADVDIRRVG